jgi:hypothetical protein
MGSSGRQPDGFPNTMHHRCPSSTRAGARVGVLGWRGEDRLTRGRRSDNETVEQYENVRSDPMGSVDSEPAGCSTSSRGNTGGTVHTS